MFNGGVGDEIFVLFVGCDIVNGGDGFDGVIFNFEGIGLINVDFVLSGFNVMGMV